MSASLSFINVENVVKPPQKPVVSNSFVDGDIDNAELVDGSDEKNPMRRQPRMFTVNVPRGKTDAIINPISFETKNRQPPPKKLPTDTIRNSFIEDNIYN